MQLQCSDFTFFIRIRYYKVSKRQGAPLTLAFAI